MAAIPRGRREAPLLEFNNVTVIKGDDKKVLDSVSLSVREGENIAILGPNGAGKSSFIKTITREYYPVPGGEGFRFRVMGEERWNIFELRSLLGVVSNDLQFTFTREITGAEVVLSGFFGGIGLYHERVTPAMRKKAASVLEFLEIGHLGGRTLNEMSSGEARRFLIGRALVHDPRALVLDEPTTSLDMHALFRFTTLLRKISRSGTGVILVTQNLADIIPEITRVILMKGGRFVMDGKKEKILTGENIGKLFSARVEIRRKDGYYYGLRG